MKNLKKTFTILSLTGLIALGGFAYASDFNSSQEPNNSYTENCHGKNHRNHRKMKHNHMRKHEIRHRR